MIKTVVQKHHIKTIRILSTIHHQIRCDLSSDHVMYINPFPLASIQIKVEIQRSLQHKEIYKSQTKFNPFL